ncbi:hypothetical protein EPN90_04225 [Patescibacteria group bacterium]|nr:MAG: hypothetical protein EPN90_04225 [Patescibacteria group bacterium]
MTPSEELHNHLTRHQAGIGEVQISWDSVGEDGSMEVRLFDSGGTLFDVWAGPMIVPPKDAIVWRFLALIVERALGPNRVRQSTIRNRSISFKIQ